MSTYLEWPYTWNDRILEMATYLEWPHTWNGHTLGMAAYLEWPYTWNDHIFGVDREEWTYAVTVWKPQLGRKKVGEKRKRWCGMFK